MATRFYLQSTGSPALTPSTWSAGWTNTAQAAGPFPCSPTKASTAFAEETIAPVSGTPGFSASLRWVSAALAAQTISGTVKGVIRGYHDSNALNDMLAIAIKVVQSGGSDRGVLLAVTASDSTSTPPEFTTSAATRRFQDTSEATDLTLSDVAAQDGDHLVIEVGVRTTGGNSTRQNLLRYGDAAASDFAHTDALTTDLNPWVEFTDDITFYSPPSFNPAWARGSNVLIGI
jgi:hypothetical protein